MNKQTLSISLTVSRAGQFLAHQHRFILIGVVLFMTALALSIMETAKAQGQTCRDVVNLTICGDMFAENPNKPGSGEFKLAGHLKLGPRGGPALIEVTDMDSTFDRRA